MRLHRQHRYPLSGSSRQQMKLQKEQNILKAYKPHGKGGEFSKNTVLTFSVIPLRNPITDVRASIKRIHTKAPSKDPPTNVKSFRRD